MLELRFIFIQHQKLIYFINNLIAQSWKQNFPFLKRISLTFWKLLHRVWFLAWKSPTNYSIPHLLDVPRTCWAGWRTATWTQHLLNGSHVRVLSSTSRTHHCWLLSCGNNLHSHPPRTRVHTWSVQSVQKYSVQSGNIMKCTECWCHDVPSVVSPPVPVPRPPATEVEGQVEEARHHDGPHHHPRVGDDQAHVLQLDLAARAFLIQRILHIIRVKQTSGWIDYLW